MAEKEVLEIEKLGIGTSIAECAKRYKSSESTIYRIGAAKHRFNSKEYKLMHLPSLMAKADLNKKKSSYRLERKRKRVNRSL